MATYPGDQYDSSSSATASVSVTADTTVSGMVEQTDGTTEPNVMVQACGSGVVNCESTTTDSSGDYTLNVTPGSVITLTAFPPAGQSGSQASPASDGPLTVPAGGLSAQNILLPSTQVSSSGAVFSLSFPQTAGAPAPVVSGYNSTSISATGCANGFDVFSITGSTNFDNSSASGSWQSQIDLLPESPPGSGNYAGLVPPEFPIHGAADVENTIFCPPPASALYPSLGSAAGGNTVLISGSGFTGATGVTFGGVPATHVSVVSDDLITAVAPPGEGTVAVDVVQSDGISTSVDQYTYQAVQAISPANGTAAGGTWVDVSGTGLGSADYVWFGTTAAQFASLGDDQLEVLAPPGTGTVDITVETAYGGTTPDVTADRYTYGPASAGDRRAAARDAALYAQARKLAHKFSGHYRSLARSAATSTKREKEFLEPTANVGLSDTAVSDTAMQSFDDSDLSLRPNLSGQQIGGAVLSWIYNHAASLFSKYSDAQSEIDAIMSNLNPTCQSDQTALEGAISTLVSPIQSELVLAVLPTVEAWVASATWELGPGALVAVALTPLAVNYAADAFVSKLIHTAVVAALGPCDNGEGTVNLPPTPPKPPTEPNPDPNNPNPYPRNGSNAYIDPGGTVLDTNVNPVDGASVTILRSSTVSGSYSPVSTTEPGLLPAVNPETTAANGVFDWDVFAGFYEVQASASGCTSATDPSDDTATIGPYPVPPPQLGLTVTLACSNEAPAPLPVVNGLTVADGPVAGGTAVTVQGSGFTPASTVDFGHAAATQVTYLSPGALIAVSPAGSAGPVDVTVTTAGGTSLTSAADSFFYGAAPVVNALSVSTGPTAGGTSVTVTGSGFTGATAVSFGGAPGINLTVDSDTKLTVTTTAAVPGVADVLVDTPAGGSAASAADRFTFIPPAPSCNPVTVSVPNATATAIQLSCSGDGGVVYDQPGSPSHGTLSTVDSSTGAVTYTPAAGYSGPDSFSYTAHNAGGTSTSATVTLVVAAGKGTTTPPVAPVLSRLTQLHSSWLERRVRRSKLPVGTTFSFVLSKSATVTFEFSEQKTGRRSGKRCLAAAHVTKRDSCERIVVVGTLTVKGAAGANHVKFSGHLAKGSLAPGRYTLTVTAVAAGVTSKLAGPLRFVIDR
jgi:hypothetical protein